MKLSSSNITNNKKGVTLLLVILILAVVFAIAIGLTEIILVQMKISGRVEDSVVAFYAADSGIECQLYSIRKSPTSSCPTKDNNWLDNKAFLFDLNSLISTSTNSYIDSIGQGPFLSRRGIKVEW